METPTPHDRVTSRMRTRVGWIALVLVVPLLAGCTAKPLLAPRSDRVQVVTTTGLLRDLVQQVGGERVQVASIVPDGADPHVYEPTLA